MSARAVVLPFPWAGTQVGPPEPEAPLPPEMSPEMAPDVRAAIEQEAFTQGFARGEEAGAEAARERIEAMLRRLADTLDELTALRAQMMRQTERQMVQLALAIARRIVLRETSIDPNVLVAMARVALDRLAESDKVTVRLNPIDYEAARLDRLTQFAGSTVNVVADAQVSRGGCRVESAEGTLEVGVEAQIDEVARVLIGAHADAATLDESLHAVATQTGD